MQKYNYYLNFLLVNGFSTLLKIDEHETNAMFKCIKVRIFTLKEVIIKDNKKVKGLFKDYFLTLNINQIDFTEELTNVMEVFCSNELKEMK